MSSISSCSRLAWEHTPYRHLGWWLGLLLLPASQGVGAEDRINRMILTMNPSREPGRSEVLRRGDVIEALNAVRLMHGSLRIGPVDFIPRFSAALTYDDNIYLREEDVQGDFYATLSPGITAGIGDYALRTENYVTVDYTPRIQFFVQETQNDTVDHTFRGYAQAAFSKFTLGVRQEVDLSSGGITEISARVSRRVYTTQILTRFDLTGKTSLEVNGSQSINDYQELLGYNEWLNQNWLNFQVKPKINAGAGLAFGYRDLSVGPDQTFQQFWLRGAYDMSEKVALLASFGMEARQYSDGGNELGPIFAVGVTYAPFDSTSFGLNATRSEQPSVALAGQNYTTTGFDFRIRQRFLQRVFVSVGGGYNLVEYNATAAGVAASRVDSQYSFSLGANWEMTRHLLLSAFYSHRENISNQLSFQNNQVSLQTTFTF